MNRISTNRTALMGVAILLVVLFHMTYRLANNGIQHIPFTHCMIGVDIFFFLSGYGLYYSLTKNSSITKFYKKRFIRIIPFYAVVVFVSLLLSNQLSFKTFILESTTLGYWLTGEYFDWYVPNLILCYLVFPIWFHTIKWNICVSSIIFTIFTFTVITLPHSSNVNFMALARYPSFILGSLIACVLDKDLYSKRNTLIITLSLICGSIVIVFSHLNFTNEQLIHNGWLFKPHIFIVLGLCLLLVEFLQRCKICQNICNVFGKMSFEVYLLHGIFVGQAIHISEQYQLQKTIIGSISLLISFFVAYLCYIINSNYLYNK